MSKPYLLKVPSFDDMCSLISPYQDYVKELHTYSYYVDTEINLNYLFGFDQYGFTHIFLDEEHGKKPVGFVIIKYKSGEHPIFKHIYICEFYVIPECRNKGYGKEIFNILIDKYDPEEISLEIIDKNEPAMEFWLNHIFKDKEKLKEEHDGWLTTYKFKMK